LDQMIMKSSPCYCSIDLELITFRYETVYITTIYRNITLGIVFYIFS